MNGLELNKVKMDNESYYKKIKNLNIQHYTGEVPYYSKAALRLVEEIILTNLPRESKILDLGCGSGRFSMGATKLGFNVTGVDITPESVRAAQRRAEDSGITNVQFLVGDMTELPFKNGEFDYVFCPHFSINAVATIEKRKKAIKEMTRVVKPDGLVFVESFNKFYCGTGPILPLANIIRDSFRHIKMFLCKLVNKPYGSLLPGDITYKANKVDGASDGYAHLPTIFEIKTWIPNGKKYVFLSIPQITKRIKNDLLKHIRYSIWIVIGENNRINRNK